MALWGSVIGPRRGRPPRSLPCVHEPVPAAAVWRVLGWAVASVAVFKVLQAASDQVFGGGEYPAQVRNELIEEHIDLYGCWCPDCDRNVPRQLLTVDHRVALVNGGLTSRWNARVICGSCNSRKGAANSPLDYLMGRSL